jgi:hypothetical protein
MFAHESTIRFPYLNTFLAQENRNSSKFYAVTMQSPFLAVYD